MLLQVDRPFVKSEQISFATLPSPNDVINANDLATVSGWGRLWVSQAFYTDGIYYISTKIN